jgi:hypothetical protein
MENEERTDSFFEHHGILGMHWGHRKAESVSVSHPDHLKKEELKKKPIHTQSNIEIKQFNERMQLEKSYHELNKRKVSAGEKWVKNLLVGGASVTASAYLGKYMGKGAELLLAKATTKMAEHAAAKAVEAALVKRIMIAMLARA